MEAIMPSTVKLDVYCLQEKIVIGTLPIDVRGKSETLKPGTLHQFIPVDDTYRLVQKDIASYVQLLCPHCRGVLYIGSGDDRQLLVPDNLKIIAGTVRDGV
jgi:hypothetical protein